MFCMFYFLDISRNIRLWAELIGVFKIKSCKFLAKCKNSQMHRYSLNLSNIPFISILYLIFPAEIMFPEIVFIKFSIFFQVHIWNTMSRNRLLNFKKIRNFLCFKKIKLEHLHENDWFRIWSNILEVIEGVINCSTTKQF